MTFNQFTIKYLKKFNESYKEHIVWLKEHNRESEVPEWETQIEKNNKRIIEFQKRELSA